MGSKGNILKKIEIDQLARQTIQSLKPPRTGSQFDKTAMRKILTLGKLPTRKERDLELYIIENDAEKKKILVLDNGLAIYHTSIKDVCMRKSPTVKEMLSIRNAFKILNDKDVVISKKEDSVRSIQAKIIGNLDLAYTAADIEGIEKEGQASLESRYADGVVEALSLFAELLNYHEAPNAFHVPHHRIWGAEKTTKAGKTTWGPLVIYAMADNTLRLIDTPIDTSDKEKMDTFRKIVDGHVEPDMEGLPVFKYLKVAVPAYRS
jgi:hypothetical protein